MGVCTGYRGMSTDYRPDFGGEKDLEPTRVSLLSHEPPVWPAVPLSWSFAAGASCVGAYVFSLKFTES